MNPWTLLQQALGYTLAFFYELIPNYGIAIILLTLVISLLLFPLTLKQTRSMRAMQEIQPEVKALQKELKGDKEELNKQLMALYKERGVNPAAGCLPLLLQMPIWFALFRVLRVTYNPETMSLDPGNVIPADSSLASALEAGDTLFLGMNLQESAAEAFSVGIVEAIPYLILIAVVIVASYYQQAQTTRRSKKNGQDVTPQAQGMQTAMKIMPLFMGFISWGFPSGLVLYFAVSAIFRIGQQAVIIGMDDDDGDGKQAGGEPATKGNDIPPNGENDSGNGDAKQSKIAPNTSKKRKRRRK
jgi:YidC/Oxa1 family membrane protein insertase